MDTYQEKSLDFANFFLNMVVLECKTQNLEDHDLDPIATQFHKVAWKYQSPYGLSKKTPLKKSFKKMKELIMKFYKEPRNECFEFWLIKKDYDTC